MPHFAACPATIELGAADTGVDTRDILVEPGRRRMVGDRRDLRFVAALDLTATGRRIRHD